MELISIFAINSLSKRVSEQEIIDINSMIERVLDYSPKPNNTLDLPR